MGLLKDLNIVGQLEGKDTTLFQEAEYHPLATLLWLGVVLDAIS